jgi:hypothetical protein
LAEDGSDRTAAHSKNYGRLAEVKRACNPDNLFRVNRNIHRLDGQSISVGEEGESNDHSGTRTDA